MLGKKSKFAEEAHKGNFIGADFDVKDLTDQLSEDWKDFIPIYLESHPEKTKISAGLASSMLWRIAKGMNIGDMVLCPNGEGGYLVGEITGNYEYHAGQILPHRRSVRWDTRTILKSEMSESLRNSAGSIATLTDVSKYSEEIEKIISGGSSGLLFSTDETIESASEFALETHLEDFLVKNWKSTEIGKDFDIYEEEGEMVGKQYPSDTGPIDILALSKDKKTILVIELKRGRASDVVVGQIQRYMGYVKEELAEEYQSVKGIIIAFEDDLRIQRALSVVNNIEFYTYKIHFKLEKKKII